MFLATGWWQTFLNGRPLNIYCLLESHIFNMIIFFKKQTIVNKATRTKPVIVVLYSQ